MAFNTAEGRAVYTASSAQTEFTFTFKVFTTADIKVYQTVSGDTPNDTTDLLTITTDYTVTINGDNGGTVTLNTGAGTGDTITLVRDLDVKRDVDYQDNGDLLASTLDSDQNYQTYLIQQAQTANARTIRLQDTTDADAMLPAPNAGYIFRWNLDGDGIEAINPADVLDTTNTITVETIANLSTIDTVAFKTAIVKDSNRGGIFTWSSTGTANGGTVFAGSTGYWNRQYSGLLSAKWFGVVGDGNTDDTTYLQLALSFGDTSLYGIEELLVSTITVPANTKLITNGCKIKSDGTANIVVTMSEGSHCDNLIIYADAQKANTSNLLYGAVKINGSDVTVNYINVSMFDYAVTIYSADNFKCNSIYASSYVRGVYIRDSDTANIKSIKAEIASSNSSATAGHNGLLISSGINHVIGSVEVSNAGEHGVRIGGAYSGEDVVEYLTIGTIIARQIGQCGLKINPNLSQRVSYVNIGEVVVTDCAYNNSTGLNEDGVRIQKTSNINIDSISIFKDIKAVSCYDGVFIDDSVNLHIGTVNVDTPLRDGIHIQDVSADDGAVFADVNNIFIDNISIYTPTNSGVYVTSTTQSLRYIVMPNIYVAQPTNRGVEVYATTVAQNCLFNGFVNTPVNEAFIGSALSNLQVNIQCNTVGKSYGVKCSGNGVNTIEQKSSFSNANIANADAIFIQNYGTESAGSYGGAISFSGTGTSGRRRASIVAKQTGASAPQVGIEFWVHNSSTSSTDALDRALTLQHDGTLSLNVDNTSSLGTATYRWSTVYAGTGTINTSDILEKTFYEISESERLCAIELKGMMRKFKFNDAIDIKGEDNARIHFGVGAQYVRDVFSKYELDPFEYALLCYDSWEDELDEEGNIIVKAGDRYGIRYEELLCFIISAM